MTAQGFRVRIDNEILPYQLFTVRLADEIRAKGALTTRPVAAVDPGIRCSAWINHPVRNCSERKLKIGLSALSDFLGFGDDGQLPLIAGRSKSHFSSSPTSHLHSSLALMLTSGPTLGTLPS
jgi:hypothetical protein